MLTQTVAGGAEHAQNKHSRQPKGDAAPSGRRPKGTSYVSFGGLSGQSYSSKVYSSTVNPLYEHSLGGPLRMLVNRLFLYPKQNTELSQGSE